MEEQLERTPITDPGRQREKTREKGAVEISGFCILFSSISTNLDLRDIVLNGASPERNGPSLARSILFFVRFVEHPKQAFSDVGCWDRIG